MSSCVTVTPHQWGSSRADRGKHVQYNLRLKKASWTSPRRRNSPVRARWLFDVIDQKEFFHHTSRASRWAQNIAVRKDTFDGLLEREWDGRDCLYYVVFKVIITVKARCDDTQRKANNDTATIAGFNVLRPTNKPRIAHLAYQFDKRVTKNRSVLVMTLARVHSMC